MWASEILVTLVTGPKLLNIHYYISKSQNYFLFG